MMLLSKNQGKNDKSIEWKISGATKNLKNNGEAELLKLKKNAFPISKKESQQRKHLHRGKNDRSKSSLIGEKCLSEKDVKKTINNAKNEDDSQTEVKAQGTSQKNKLIELQLEQQERIRERIVQSTSIQGNGDNSSPNKIKISSQFRKILPAPTPKVKQAVGASDYESKVRQEQVLEYQQICNEIQLKNLQSRAIPQIQSGKFQKKDNLFNQVGESQSGVIRQLYQQGKISQTHSIPAFGEEYFGNYQQPIQQQTFVKRREQSVLHLNSDEEEKVNRSVMRTVGKIQSNSGRRSIKASNQIRINNRQPKQGSDSMEQKQYHPIINQSKVVVAPKTQSIPSVSGKINRRRNLNITIVPETVNISLNQINQEVGNKKEESTLNQEIVQLRKTVRQLRLEKIKAQAQLTEPLQLLPSSISKTISFEEPSRHRYQTLDSVVTSSNQFKDQLTEHRRDVEKPLFGKIRKNRSLSTRKSEQLNPPPNYLSTISGETRFNISSKQSELLKQYQTVCLQKIAEQRLQQSVVPQQMIYTAHRPYQQSNHLNMSMRSMEICETVLNKFQRSDRKFKHFMQKEASKSKMIRNIGILQGQLDQMDNPQLSKQFTDDFNDQEEVIERDQKFSPDKCEYISAKNMSLIIQGQKLKLQKKIIKLHDKAIPNIPEAPNQNTDTEELMNLIIQILPFSGKSYAKQDMNGCILKRYKNCITFQVSSTANFRIVWHFTNKLYLGEWDAISNQKHGKGIEIIKDKSLYRGQFVDGKKNGRGLMIHSSGTIYEGEWMNGQRQGYGKYKDNAKSCYYEGHWKNGKKQGPGHYDYNQNIYEGQFYKNVKCGFGVQLFQNGDRYIGEYQNGQFHGDGKYVWKNGAYYIGHFSGGYKHGRGKWQSGGQDCEIYIGQFEKDKKQGKGKYAWSNRCIYEGSFHNDLKHGMGNIQYPDGRYMQGIWTLGILTEVISKVTEAHRQEPLQQPKSRSIQTRTIIKVFDKTDSLAE